MIDNVCIFVISYAAIVYFYSINIILIKNRLLILLASSIDDGGSIGFADVDALKDLMMGVVSSSR